MGDEQIGLQIKKARMEKGLSQEDLGEKLSVTWEMISRYENGRSSARKYLVQLSEILEKPISYFFGVQESLSTNIVEQIVKSLKENDIGLQQGYINKVPLVDDMSILGFAKSLKFTRQVYTAPDWIIEKYKDIFALRLASTAYEGIEVGEGDIGFFSPGIEPQADDIVLVEDISFYKLRKFSPEEKNSVVAVLIMQEKRYR